MTTPLIHYSIEVAGRCLADGRTPSPPAVGDTLALDGQTYIVQARHWQRAEDTLGPDATIAWGHATPDLIFVTLRCVRSV